MGVRARRANIYKPQPSLLDFEPKKSNRQGINETNKASNF